MNTEQKSAWQVPVHEVHELGPKSKKYVALVVIWNEGERIQRQLQEMQSQLHSVDIILSDGYSQDGSIPIEFLKNMNVCALMQTHERGLGCAIRVGLAYALQAGYAGIITIDGNNKDGTDEIQNVVKKLDEGYDLIQASRFMKGGVHSNTPLERFIGIRFVIAPLLAMGCHYWFTDPTNGFKGLSRIYLEDPRVVPLRDVFKKFSMQFYLNYRAPKLKLRTTEIPASRRYPSDGSLPTKIHGFSAKFVIIWELILVTIGFYNPKN